MPQSLSNVLIHIVFSTKSRERFIHPAIETELHRYMAGTLRALESPALSINGTEDHVHILCALSRRTAISDLVEEVKKSSSKWMKTKGSEYRRFFWQTGYGAFSIGESNRDACLRYIARQKRRHKKQSFQDEYREILRTSHSMNGMFGIRPITLFQSSADQRPFSQGRCPWLSHSTPLGSL